MAFFNKLRRYWGKCAAIAATGLLTAAVYLLPAKAQTDVPEGRTGCENALATVWLPDKVTGALISQTSLNKCACAFFKLDALTLKEADNSDAPIKVFQ